MESQLMNYANTHEELIERMTSCFQFENMNMLQHGEAVHEAFNRLIVQLNGGDQILELPP
jgi:hypothetical protein